MSELEKFKLHYEYNETNSELREALGKVRKMATIIKSDLRKKEQSKQKKEETVKNSTKKTAIVSVISTLLIVAVIAAIFYGGMKFEQNRQAVITTQAAELAGKLKANQ